MNDRLPVVVGVDASTHARTAALWAAREATARGCPLHVVHASLWPLVRTPGGPLSVGSHEALTEAAHRLLAETADACRAESPGLVVHTELVPREAVRVLVERSARAELVVVGHGGLGRFTGLLVGSVGVGLAAAAACPVVVVRSADGSPPLDGPVVVGVDGSALSEAATGFAFEAAARHGCPLVATHAWHSPLDSDFLTHLLEAGMGWDEQLAAAEREVRERLAAWRRRYPGVGVRVRVDYGHPAPTVLEVARSEGARLLVLGARGRGGVTGALLGSTSHAALHHAPCPVAVVRAAAGRVESTQDSPQKTDV